jgi:hypothetical protein
MPYQGLTAIAALTLGALSFGVGPPPGVAAGSSA